MPTISTSNLPTPKDDNEFQEIVRDLFALHWQDDNVQNYGRSGQAQNGVDVYLLGHPLKKTNTFAIQCKARKDKLTKAEIVKEIGQAKSFSHKIGRFIFATTLARDTKIQDIIDTLSVEEVKNGGFEVNIIFWEDIISLLAEHTQIAQKYYPQFFGKPQRMKFSSDLEERSEEINVASPLLVGLLFDLSKSMVLETMNNLSKPLKFDELAKYIVFKISTFCKAADSKEVLNKFQLFMFGYGLGGTRKKTYELLNRLGIGSKKNDPSLISDSPIRDLFAETALTQSVPYTPNLSILNKYWTIYENSLNKQLYDIGSGDSNLYEGLVEICERYKTDLLKKPYSKYPLLLIISNGRFDNTTEIDLKRIVDEIKSLNVQIACIVVDEDDIIEKYKLYGNAEKTWKKEYNLLFELSSSFETKSHFYSEILTIAKENDWLVPQNPKLFFQINQTEMINDLIDLIFKPLQTDS